MYSVIQILIFKYVSMCTRKKEHEKLSTKMVPMILLPSDTMITGSYVLNSIHTFSQRAHVTLLN